MQLSRRRGTTAFLWSAAAAPCIRWLCRGFAGRRYWTDDWAREFGSWLTDAVTRGDRVSLLDYRKRAPYAEHAHPYPDRFMPLLVAFGAAGDGARGTVLHRSWNWGNLMTDAYEFRSD